jgi:voltage-gated potassium channel
MNDLVRVFFTFIYDIKNKILYKIIIFFIIVLFIGYLGILFFEYGQNKQFENFFDIFYFLIVTITTVGYGDKFPQTIGGKLTTLFVIIFSILFIALFSAMAAAIFIEKKLKEELGMNSYNLSNHVVIIGWNLKALKIIEKIQSDKKFLHKKIGILANIEKKPIDIPLIHFVKATNPIHSDQLAAISIKKAETIILLADYSIKQNSDAITAINCLLARKYNPKAKIVTEMLNPSSKEYLESAGADYIIGVPEIGGELIGEACLNSNNYKNHLQELGITV